jgi:predicted mannosyl-3-phosphoglycerate phosphatase (HAD superfamily)
LVGGGLASTPFNQLSHSLVQSFPSIMPTLRRTQTIYVAVDPFLSARGAVLHHFDEFLAGLDDVDFPCIWLTGLTRAQLDEPRRRLGHNDPFIAESGGGVYLPEDYFHLKSGDTIRLGRFTCIPIAKPRPAAAEALEDLSRDLGINVVSLRSLSLRELSQNTGLPAGEAEQIRMRDFDELFFFAGAMESDISKFAGEAKLRELTLQNLGSFWSLSCGANIAKGIRELGTLYDRALRYHAPRIGVTVTASAEPAALDSDPRLKALLSSCDRTLLLTERRDGSASGSSDDDADDDSGGDDSGREDSGDSSAAASLPTPSSLRSSSSRKITAANTFHLHSPDLWESALAAILARK